MTKKLLALLAFVLAGGTVFAWFTVFGDFSRYLNANGIITDLSGGGCKYPNPLATPCFYGAIAFLVALGWSVNLLMMKTNQEDKLAKSQKHLNWLLVASVIFAWSNFTRELVKYYRPHTGPFLSCSGTVAANPFFTPCFYGSAIFLCALVISLILRRSLSRKQIFLT